SIYDIIFFIFCFFFFFFFSSRRRHTRSKRDWSSDVCSSDLIYTFKGIAPNANLINLRALDQNGSGTDGTVISAIQEAIQLKSMYNIRVINLSLSLGRPVFESYKLDPLCQAVEAAWKTGIVVVVAAGNSGRDNS